MSVRGRLLHSGWLGTVWGNSQIEVRLEISFEVRIRFTEEHWDGLAIGNGQHHLRSENKIIKHA